jgi:hypothetical protein
MMRCSPSVARRASSKSRSLRLPMRSQGMIRPLLTPAMRKASRSGQCRWIEWPQRSAISEAITSASSRFARPEKVRDVELFHPVTAPRQALEAIPVARGADHREDDEHHAVSHLLDLRDDVRPARVQLDSTCCRPDMM